MWFGTHVNVQTATMSSFEPSEPSLSARSPQATIANAAMTPNNSMVDPKALPADPSRPSPSSGSKRQVSGIADLPAKRSAVDTTASTTASTAEDMIVDDADFLVVPVRSTSVLRTVAHGAIILRDEERATLPPLETNVNTHKTVAAVSDAEDPWYGDDPGTDAARVDASVSDADLFDFSDKTERNQRTSFDTLPPQKEMIAFFKQRDIDDGTINEMVHEGNQALFMYFKQMGGGKQEDIDENDAETSGRLLVLKLMGKAAGPRDEIYKDKLEQRFNELSTLSSSGVTIGIGSTKQKDKFGSNHVIIVLEIPPDAPESFAAKLLKLDEFKFQSDVYKVLTLQGWLDTIKVHEIKGRHIGIVLCGIPFRITEAYAEHLADIINLRHRFGDLIKTTINARREGSGSDGSVTYSFDLGNQVAPKMRPTIQVIYDGTRIGKLDPKLHQIRVIGTENCRACPSFDGNCVDKAACAATIARDKFKFEAKRQC